MKAGVVETAAQNSLTVSSSKRSASQSPEPVASSTSSRNKKQRSDPLDTDTNAAMDGLTMDSNGKERATTAQETLPTLTDVTPRSERDVGITEYLSAHLPAFEAIIKQRFSDFQVFEVPLPETGSTTIPEPCHITSLDPPGALLEVLAQERAERADPSLREARVARERKEREEERRKRDDEASKLREAQGVWPEGADERLGELLGENVKEQVKKLYLEGPKRDENGGSGRGGRGRGRGGRGGARGGVKDTRCVVTDTLDSKDARTAVHQLIREVFNGQLSTEATARGDATASESQAADVKPDTQPSTEAPKDDRMDTSEDAAKSSAETSKAATAALDAAKANANAITIRWGGGGNWDVRRPDPRKTAEEAAKTDLPPFIHFLLQKTNRESHDALKIIARTLGLGAGPNRGSHTSHGSVRINELAVAGTKDRRGITVQRVSLNRGRKTIEDVWKTMNGIGREVDGGGGRGRGRGRGRGGFGGGGPRRTILEAIETRGERGVRIAHLKYANNELRLGQLYGNAFNITLRNVKVEDPSMIEEAMEGLREKGFINYFGMQRFGTAATGTHEIGVPLFQGDYARACHLLLQLRGDYEGEEVCEARKCFLQGDTQGALDLMPRSFVAERAVMEHVRGVERKGGKRGDWESAFTQIPRSLRIMYVHAYQSYVWNHMVSERLKRFGSDKPIVGDYVLLDGGSVEQAVEVEEGAATADVGDDDEEAMANGAPAVKPRGVAEDEEDPDDARPYILTEADLDKYTIHDVVMPMPGKRVVLTPGGWMADLHAEMLAKDGLDVASIGNAKVFDYALRGTYRKMLHRPTSLSHRLIRYADPDVPLTQSDEEKILGLEIPPVSLAEEITASNEILGTGPFLALCVQLTLSSSAYATMALREVLKTDTSAAAQREASRRSGDQVSKRRALDEMDEDDQNEEGSAGDDDRTSSTRREGYSASRGSGRGGDRDRGGRGFSRGGRGDRDRGRGRGGFRFGRSGDDCNNPDTSWGSRERAATGEVNKVSGSKTRVWGTAGAEATSTDSAEGGGEPAASISVSAAAQEEFRRAREVAQMMEEMEDERRSKS